MASTKTHYSDATLNNFRTCVEFRMKLLFTRRLIFLHPTFEQLLSTFNTAGDRPYNPNASVSRSRRGATPRHEPRRSMVSDPLDQYPAGIFHLGQREQSVHLFGDPSYSIPRCKRRRAVRFLTEPASPRTRSSSEHSSVHHRLMANGAVAGLETAAS